MKYVIFEKEERTEDFFNTKEEAENYLAECNNKYIVEYDVTIREVEDYVKKVFDFLYDDHSPLFDKQEELYNIFLEDKELFNKVYEVYFSDNHNDVEEKIYNSEFFRVEIDERIEDAIISKNFNEKTLFEIEQDILKRFRGYNKYIKKNDEYFHAQLSYDFEYANKYELRGTIESVGNKRNNYEWKISLRADDGDNFVDLERFSLSDEELRYLIEHYTIDLKVVTKITASFGED